MKLHDFNKKNLPAKCSAQHDALYDKLKAYHDKLSSEVSNIVTEKITEEVTKVLDDLEKVDEICTSFGWSADEESRLNHLNEQVKNLQPRNDWYWGANDGSEQGQYNEKRMQFCLEEELQPKLIHLQ